MNQRSLLGVIGVLVLIVGLLIGFLVGGGGGDDDSPDTETSAADDTPPTTTTLGAAAEAASTTSTLPPATTTTTTTTLPPATTTTLLPPGSGVLMAGAGVPGWVDGSGAWIPVGDGPVPVVDGETYQVIRLGESPTLVTAGAIRDGCHLIAGSLFVDGLIDFDDYPDYPVAMAGNWNPLPHSVQILSNDNATYQQAISDLLAGQGVDDPSPTLHQVIRTDLEGDGIDEVIIAAGHDGDFGTVDSGDYSILVLRKLIEGEVQTAILGFFEADEPGPYMIIHRVAAVADLNGDGRMEIAVNDWYYEGGGTTIFDYVDDDLGPWPVLEVGCGV